MGFYMLSGDITDPSCSRAMDADILCGYTDLDISMASEVSTGHWDQHGLQWQAWSMDISMTSGSSPTMNFWISFGGNTDPGCSRTLAPNMAIGSSKDHRQLSWQHRPCTSAWTWRPPVPPLLLFLPSLHQILAQHSCDLHLHKAVSR